MVGRTRAGDPLVPIQAEPIPGTDPRTVTQNQFTYEAIQLARGVLSAHMFAERIRATATFLSGASVHFENLSLCWVSVRRDSTMI